MRCKLTPASIVLMLLIGSWMSASGQQSTPSDRPVDSSRHADFKVVVWFRRDRPLESFSYQIYDLRKGEYSPAVDDWVQLMRTKYPGYYLAIRDVRLEDEKGETELLKVGAVVKR